MERIRGVLGAIAVASYSSRSLFMRSINMRSLHVSGLVPPKVRPAGSGSSVWPRLRVMNAGGMPRLGGASSGCSTTASAVLSASKVFVLPVTAHRSARFEVRPVGATIGEGEV